MNQKVIDELKSKNAKLFIVTEDLETIIKQLSSTLDTSAHDVVLTACKLLQKSLNKKIILRDIKNATDVEINTFEDLSSEPEEKS